MESTELNNIERPPADGEPIDRGIPLEYNMPETNYINMDEPSTSAAAAAAAATAATTVTNVRRSLRIAAVVGSTSATEPVAAEPVATEPVAAEPVAAEPVDTEPVAAESIAAEPIAAEPVAVVNQTSTIPMKKCANEDTHVTAESRTATKGRRSHRRRSAPKPGRAAANPRRVRQRRPTNQNRGVTTGPNVITRSAAARACANAAATMAALNAEALAAPNQNPEQRNENMISMAPSHGLRGALNIVPNLNYNIVTTANNNLLSARNYRSTTLVRIQILHQSRQYGRNRLNINGNAVDDITIRNRISLFVNTIRMIFMTFAGMAIRVRPRNRGWNSLQEAIHRFNNGYDDNPSPMITVGGEISLAPSFRPVYNGGRRPVYGDEIIFDFDYRPYTGIQREIPMSDVTLARFVDSNSPAHVISILMTVPQRLMHRTGERVGGILM